MNIGMVVVALWLFSLIFGQAYLLLFRKDLWIEWAWRKHARVFGLDVVIRDEEKLKKMSRLLGGFFLMSGIGLLIVLASAGAFHIT